MMRGHLQSKGSTLVELVIGLSVLGMVGLSFFGFFNALITSSIAAKQKAVASTLANNQMEYLKSLPYNSLAVAGGSIYAQNPLPASSTSKVNNYTFTVRTSINYVDDAFDGCTNYPTQQLKETYCRNLPSPAGSPAVDQNPQDYKVVHVSTYNRSNVKLAEVDTQISARVAETASNTGSLFINIIDGSGNPVQGATAQVANTTLVPQINLSDTTDSQGVAVFYGLPPDTSSFDYRLTATKTGYSSLSTIIPSGGLQPNYPSQNIFAQQPSYATLVINQQSTHSLAIETFTTTGAPLDGVSVYAKGGYKRYNSPADTSYYYDNLSPSDTRVTSDAGGLASLTNLAPGDYYFCGDNGATGCSRGGVNYYLAAAIPFGGTSIFSPIAVPTTNASAAVFPYAGNDYVQKARLILTSNPSFPRISAMTPGEASLASGNLTAFAFQINGHNLPCDSNPASCDTSVVLGQGTLNFPASCSGAVTGLQLDCTVNLSAAVQGRTSLTITANGQSLTIADSLALGGLNVGP